MIRSAHVVAVAVVAALGGGGARGGRAIRRRRAAGSRRTRASSRRRRNGAPDGYVFTPAAPVPPGTPAAKAPKLLTEQAYAVDGQRSAVVQTPDGKASTAYQTEKFVPGGVYTLSVSTGSYVPAAGAGDGPAVLRHERRAGPGDEAGRGPQRERRAPGEAGLPRGDGAGEGGHREVLRHDELRTAALGLRRAAARGVLGEEGSAEPGDRRVGPVRDGHRGRNRALPRHRHQRRHPGPHRDHGAGPVVRRRRSSRSRWPRARTGS